MDENTNRLSRWLGKQWRLLALVAVIAALAAWYNHYIQKEMDQTRAATAERLREPEIRIPPTEAETCKLEIADRQTEYEAKRLAGDHWGAANLLRRCAQITKDPKALEQVRQAEADDRWVTLQDKSKSAGERLQAFHALVQLDLPRAESAVSLRKTLEARVKKEMAAEQRVEAARRKREGVSIGMTKEDVIASSWGRPERINRTATTYGTREQWVYGVGNYLYFEGDRITAVQTGR